MAFPRLVLEGTPTTGVITDIYTKTEPDGELELGVLIKQKYTINRRATQFNVAQGPALRKGEVPYDMVSISHTWVGFMDVCSDSLAYSSTGDQATTYQLLREAWVYYNTLGIKYAVNTPTEKGVSNPSLGGINNVAFEPAPLWFTTDSTGLDGAKGTLYSADNRWMIRNIDIQDNQNGTSRVTFMFEAICIYDPIYKAIRN